MDHGVRVLRQRSPPLSTGTAAAPNAVAKAEAARSCAGQQPGSGKTRTTSARGVEQSNDVVREAACDRHDQECRRRRDWPGDEISLRSLEQKIRSQAEIEQGNQERDHAHHHARHQERQYQSVLGVHSHMSVGMATWDGSSEANAIPVLNHSVTRTGVVLWPRQSLKKS